MRRRIKTREAFGLVAAAFVLFLGASVGGGGPKGNEAKGRFYFKQTCKTCHTKGAAGGEITPMSRTQAQWARYFAKGTHHKGSEPLSKILTPEQLRDVEVFLFNHAADSPQPETCGKN